VAFSRSQSPDAANSQTAPRGLACPSARRRLAYAATGR